MGQFTGTSVAGSFKTTDFSTTDGDQLSRYQTLHVVRRTSGFNLAIGGTPATREEIIHVAEAAGTVREFVAGANNTGTATVALSFDLKKNGTTVLSGSVSVTHATSDRASVAGTISSGTYVAGDVFSVLLTATTPNDATGPFARVTFDEKAVA